jgi:hypothetical protein
MSQFTKFSEIWSALFDGRKLQCEGHSGEYFLHDGEINLTENGRSRVLKNFNFRFPTLWSIVEEPVRVNTPVKVDNPEHYAEAGGVLCTAGCDDEDERQEIIIGKTFDGYYAGISGILWPKATPAIDTDGWPQ